MGKTNSSQETQLLTKLDILQNASKVLKEEFIGIDKVIDQVVEFISSWYLFSHLQEKPLIVNLWGLTGVGKTSMVTRLAELIQYKEKHFTFDLGDRDNQWNVKSTLEEIYEDANGYPIIVSLDEFQHARTLDDKQEEIDKNENRIIWKLLDSGKFQISRYFMEGLSLFKLSQDLSFAIEKGIQVVDGLVVSHKEHFIKRINYSHNCNLLDEEADIVPFVPDVFQRDIYNVAKEKFKNIYEVRKILNSMNAHETIRYLEEIIVFGKSPKTVDCSKALIFVLGNLDEAYSMSADFNPDMDADEFHQESLKIGIPDIKKALKHRFRNEQIARLGNTHIIYPAFNKDSFRKIIAIELDKIALKIEKHENIELEYDESVHELLYNEGVYPTQGTRPLFSTIDQMINAKLGTIITENIKKQLYADRILLKASKNALHIDFKSSGSVVNTLDIPISSPLETLRENKKDDYQAITAVHEAGHALLSCALLKVLPTIICSKTADTEASGFVYTKLQWKYISKKEIKNRLALYLGGTAAETIVFGSENITTGAESDIDRASRFITKMLKSSGMGDLPGSYANPDPMTTYYLYDKENKLTKQAESYLKEALSLAQETLQREENLLLKMADYLSDNRLLTQPKLLEMIHTYAVAINPEDFIENGDHLYYRAQLKKKVENLQSGIMDLTNTENLSLNKSK